MCACKARERSNRGSWTVTDQPVFRAGCVALAVWAVVDLDFPSGDTQLLRAGSQIHGRGAWSNKMIPAMLAGLLGDAKFCDAHGGGLGDVDVASLAKCCSLKYERRLDEGYGVYVGLL